MGTLALLASVVLISYISPAVAEGAGKPEARVLDREWNGKHLDMRVGEEIHIKLKFIAGTGYSWHVESMPEGVLEVIGQDVLPAKRREDIVGAAEVELWKFRARARGTGVLKLLYYRTWEGADRAAEMFEVTINVL